MEQKIRYPSLADLLRKTVLTFCEGSVKFNHCLEVVGSLHIRSDNERVATFLLDEQIYVDVNEETTKRAKSKTCEYSNEYQHVETENQPDEARNQSPLHHPKKLRKLHHRACNAEFPYERRSSGPESKHGNRHARSPSQHTAAKEEDILKRYAGRDIRKYWLSQSSSRESGVLDSPGGSTTLEVTSTRPDFMPSNDTIETNKNSDFNVTSVKPEIAVEVDETEQVTVASNSVTKETLPHHLSALSPHKPSSPRLSLSPNSAAYYSPQMVSSPHALSPQYDPVRIDAPSSCHHASLNFLDVSQTNFYPKHAHSSDRSPVTSFESTKTLSSQDSFSMDYDFGRPVTIESDPEASCSRGLSPNQINYGKSSAMMLPYFHPFQLAAMREANNSQSASSSKPITANSSQQSVYVNNSALRDTQLSGSDSWEKPVSCVECGRMLKSEKMLELHMNTAHTHKHIYPCKLCGKIFYAASSLHSHKKRTHTNIADRHKCPHCSRCYGFQSELQRHINTTHLSVPAQTSVSSSSSGSTHTVDNGGESMERQLICDSIEQQSGDSVEQQSGDSVEQQSGYSVEQQSGYSVEQQSGYSVEQQTSNSVEQQTSNSVEQQTSNSVEQQTSNSVEAVMGDSSLEMSLECDDSETLLELPPVKTSSGLRFKCRECNMLLKSRECLALHINAKHTQKHAYPCQICGRVFYAPSSRFCHMRRVHASRDQKFCCSYCDKVFTFHYELRNHMKLLHKSKLIQRSDGMEVSSLELGNILESDAQTSMSSNESSFQAEAGCLEDLQD